FGDIASAVASATGTANPTHSFTDGIAGAAQAVANAVATVGAHGGNFWDQAADAIHHATGSIGFASHGLVNVSEPIIAQQPPAADLHSTGLPGMLGDIAHHVSDAIHLGAETAAHVAQEDHAAPHFELPALHLTEFALHH